GATAELQRLSPAAHQRHTNDRNAHHALGHSADGRGRARRPADRSGGGQRALSAHGPAGAALAVRAPGTGGHPNGMKLRPLGILALGVAALAPAALIASTGRAQTAAPPRAPMSRELRPPSAFAGIRDPAARSAALFTEAGKLPQPARCLNC